jgi:hypothetical protein
VLDEDLSVLGIREGWTVEDGVATYCPPSDEWRAVVRRPVVAARAFERFHVALIDPRGRATYVRKATSVGEALRLAEGSVRAKSYRGRHRADE